VGEPLDFYKLCLEETRREALKYTYTHIQSQFESEALKHTYTHIHYLIST
jgi:hypothetical protein